VPTWFALRIAKVESNYRAAARGRHGELGVFQMKCATAKIIGYRGKCSGLLDAETGVDVISFADEEGTFLACLGSRSFCGAVGDAEIAVARNADGARLAERLEALSLGAAKLPIKTRFITRMGDA